MVPVWDTPKWKEQTDRLEERAVARKILKTFSCHPSNHSRCNRTIGRPYIAKQSEGPWHFELHNPSYIRFDNTRVSDIESQELLHNRFLEPDPEQQAQRL